MYEDFKGHKARLGQGDLQYIDSWRGMVHALMPASTKDVTKGLQIWVNSPAKDKFGEPRTLEIKSQDIPEVKTEQLNAKVLAGNFHGAEGHLAPHNAL